MQMLSLRVNGPLNGKISGRVEALQLAAPTHSIARFLAFANYHDSSNAYFLDNYRSLDTIYF